MNFNSLPPLPSAHHDLSRPLLFVCTIIITEKYLFSFFVSSVWSLTSLHLVCCVVALGVDHSYVLELNTPIEEKLVTSDMDSPILDLSKKGLKKVPKPTDGQKIRVLILDENELQKIDNIDSFLHIEKVNHRRRRRLNEFLLNFDLSFQLSLHKNNLLRMYGVYRLHHLQELILSKNKILTIEGLKDLPHLKRLDLHGNSIKTIEHLNTNQQLEYLNLSENSMGNISDISMLKNLRVFITFTELY